MTSRNPIENLSESLGDYLREQRTNARLSLRQLAERAGVSNPYLSQIERGLKRPSAEILQELAKGLQISAETLYVKAGFLDERTVSGHRPWDVEAAITADPALTDRQKDTLIDIYRSFVGEPAQESANKPTAQPAQTRTRARAVKQSATSPAPVKKAAARRTSTSSKVAAKKAAAKKSAATKAATTKTTRKTSTTKNP